MEQDKQKQREGGMPRPRVWPAQSCIDDDAPRWDGHIHVVYYIPRYIVV